MAGHKELVNKTEKTEKLKKQFQVFSVFSVFAVLSVVGECCPAKHLTSNHLVRAALTICR